MKFPAALALTVALAACASEPEALLPAGPVENFAHSRQVLQRGLTQDGVVQAQPAILDYSYTMACLADGPGAKARFGNATALMARTLPKVEPGGIGAQYKRSFAQRAANAQVVPQGCQVTQVAIRVVTDEPAEILNWAARNSVLPEATGKR